MPAALIVTALSAALSCAAPDAAPDPRADPSVVPLTARDGVNGLRATFDVSAPPDVVLETLWDVSRFRSIFPDIHSLDVLARRDAEVDARFTVDAVLATVSYTLRRHVDREHRVVSWKNIGGDLKTVRGSWTVRPDGKGGSAVAYESFVDVGTFVPTGLVRDIAMKKVNEMAGRVRAACKKAVLATLVPRAP